MQNKNYGKIEFGRLAYAPNPLWVGQVMIANPTADIYLKNGYKPIQKTEQPQKDGYYYTAVYVDNPTCIIQGWEEHKEEIVTE